MKRPTLSTRQLVVLGLGALLICAEGARAADDLLPYLLKRNSFAPTSMTFSMSFSHDGKSLAAVGLDKVVRVWNIENLQTGQSIDPPRQFHLFDGSGSVGIMFSVRYSPDDRLLSVGCNLGGFLLDAQTGRVIAHLAFPLANGTYEAFHGMAFSPDGRWLATGHTKSIRFWDLTDMRASLDAGFDFTDKSVASLSHQLIENVQHLSAHNRGHLGYVFSVEFAPGTDQVELLSAADDAVPIVWKESRGRWSAAHSLRCNSPTITAAYARIGRSIITASEDQTVRIWNNRMQQKVLLRGNSAVFRTPRISFPRDGETVVIGNWADSSECSVRRIRDGKQVTQFLLHDDMVTATASHPTEDLVATAGSRNSRICFWNPKNGEMITSINAQATTIAAVAFSHDGQSIAFGTTFLQEDALKGDRLRANNRAWEIKNHFMWGLFRSNRYTRPLARAFSLKKMAPDPNIEFAAVNIEETNWLRERLSLGGWHVDRYVSRDASAPNHNHDKVVLIKNGREVKRIGTPNQARVEACSLMTLTATGRSGIVIAANGGKLFLHELETGAVVREFVGTTSDYTSVAVSPDNQYLVAGGRDQLIRIWSLQDAGKPRRILGIGFKGNVATTVFSGLPADLAGIRTGDEILSIGRESIGGVDDVKKAISQSPSGSRLKLRYRRQGVTATTDLVPIEKPLADVKVPLLTIQMTNTGAWIAWTERGFYACSPGADNLFGWQVNNGIAKSADFHSAKSFQAALYRPDLVKTVLESHGDDSLLPEQLSVQQLLVSSQPPVVRILKPSANTVMTAPKVEVKAQIRHRPELPLQAVQVIVNGRLQRGVGLLPKLERDKTITRTVELSPGQNTISVQAVGPGGITSEAKSVRVTVKSPDGRSSGELPELHLLALGVSRHQDKTLELKFAAKDANDMVAAFRTQEGHQYAKVHAQPLTDEDVTRDRVLANLEELEQKKLHPSDYVVLFMSGHGLQDKRGEYCFVTHETDLQDIAGTTVPWFQIQKTLRRIDAKVFLFLDTCHAGAVVGVTSIADQSRDAYNEVLREAAMDTSGVITFASCLPHELSYENRTWGNGAFTKSVIDGLKGLADTNDNGVVTISEIETYASQQVESLTSRRQSTALFKSISIPSNLPIGRSSK